MAKHKRRWPRRAAKVAALLLLLLVIGIYWLFYDNRPPAEGRFPLDMAAVRAEADRLPGEKPVRIEFETINHTMEPKIALAAATSWGDLDMVRASYRAVSPTGDTIIDTANDAATSRQFGAYRFDAPAWDRMVAAMDTAAHIVVTHEHPDHMGGLLQGPHAKLILPKAILNSEQFALSDRIKPLVWPTGSRDNFKPTAYQKLLAIAPGVVLIRAPGHTPGSQLVYVQRADGQEYIFMGDTASLADNVRLMRIRSRLVTDYMTFDDRRAVFLLTKALNDLSKTDPGIVLVPGHDGPAIEAIAARGLLQRGFTTATR